MKNQLMIAAVAAILSTAGISAPAFAHSGENHAATPQSAEGQGVIKSIDAKTLTVTIQHGPIAALKWPAMTMKFKVANAEVLKGFSAGAKVHFVLQNVAGKPVVTAIHAL